MPWSGVHLLKPSVRELRECFGLPLSTVSARAMRWSPASPWPRRRWPLGRVVRFGIAAATAKLQTPGTSVFRRHDVERYFLAQLAHSEADAANLSGI